MASLLVEVSERVDGFVAREVVFLDIAVDSNFAARMRKGKRRRRGAPGRRKEPRLYTRKSGMGWWGWTRPTHDGEDGTRNHVALAPRTCRPKEAAAVGGLGKLVAPFHNWANFDWACGTRTCGEVDCIPTRGAPLCGTKWPGLGEGSPIKPRRFSLALEERHLSSHAIPCPPLYNLPELVLANLCACSGDHCFATAIAAIAALATPVVKHLEVYFPSSCPSATASLLISSCRRLYR